jgi:hypothetical protein
LVLILWVIIVYKVSFNASPDNNSGYNKDVIKNQSTMAQQTERNYSPILQNTNPFALESKHSENKLKENTFKKAKKETRMQIEYIGYTRKGRSVLANILFNSNYYILKENDTLGGYLLMEILKDSIIIKSKSGDLSSLKKKNI